MDNCTEDSINKKEDELTITDFQISITKINVEKFQNLSNNFCKGMDNYTNLIELFININWIMSENNLLNYIKDISYNILVCPLYSRNIKKIYLYLPNIISKYELKENYVQIIKQCPFFKIMKEKIKNIEIEYDTINHNVESKIIKYLIINIF